MKGLVKTGRSAGVPYCAGGLYLTDDTGQIQLRTQNKKILILDESGGGMSLFESYLDRNVVVTGNYDIVPCEALGCGCSDFIAVETIVEEPE